MADLYTALVTDIMQNDSAYDVEIQALAYAVRLEKQRIMREADKTRTVAVIDGLDESILDALAVELRSPYYSEDIPVSQKREIVRNTLLWFSKAGTPAAVAEMAAAVFGSGQVVEWFDFDPDDGEIVPGEFDIETGAEMQDPVAFMPVIEGIIDKVKNVRSHLRAVKFLRIVNDPEETAALIQSYPTVTVRA